MDELLKNLQKEYVASLPDKIATIKTHVQTPSPSDLRTIFHKLKGTGKTYGLPEVSELSAAVERICADSPLDAAQASILAAEVLQDIYNRRSGARSFDLDKDPRFAKIQKML